MPEIPIELVQEILSYLEDDTDALRSCTTVCSSWTHISRQILFDDFFIDEDDDPVTTCSTLLKALEKSPHLGSYFRYLGIDFGVPHPHPGISKIDTVARLLPDLLSHFTNIKTMEIQAKYMDWIHLPPMLVSSLQPLLPNIQTLIIQGPTFSEHGIELVHFLKHCSSKLSTFQLTNIKLMPLSLNDVDYPPVKAVLSGLECLWLQFHEDSSGSFVKDTIQTPNLRKYDRPSLASTMISPASSRFSFPFSGHKIQEIILHVTFCGSTFFGADDFHPSDIPDFTEFPHLRHIDFTLQTQLNDGPSLFPSFLRETFSKMHVENLPKLESIRTTVILPWSWELSDERVWEKVGSVLRALAHAGTFKSAIFEFNGKRDGPSESLQANQELIDGARDACGDLIEAGVMVIVPNLYLHD